jgi:hypothetical protein
LTKQEEGIETLRGEVAESRREVAENKKRINSFEAWRCSHRMHVLKEWLGIPHTDARNALFHIEADLASFRYAAEYDIANIRHLAEQAFIKGYGIEASRFSKL